MNFDRNRLVKKNYSSPKLIAYGDICELTKGAGTKSDWDGAAQKIASSNPAGFGM